MPPSGPATIGLPVAARRATFLAVALTLAVDLGAVEPEFGREVLPILSRKCFDCHGPDDAARKAELRLDQRAGALEVVDPEDPDSSELLRRVRSSDPDVRMPPPRKSEALSDAEVSTLRRWIAGGAVYSKHWSLEPPRRPPPPAVERSDWPRNAIDRFVLARLEAASLVPSGEADRATLLRRVTLDLTGLPPTPEAVAAFEADPSPDAYERAVDRLLASPRYGVHMASFWLEAARYADTDGYQNDRYRYQWVWRDWLLEALNWNLPFDEFVVDQLAGDLRPDATLRQQIATGFSRNHRINSEAGSIPEEWHVENVADRVDTLGTVFLGLTVSCARCHDHKYDPISQRDYYRLFAYFNNIAEWGIGPNNGNSPPFITVPENWPHLKPGEDVAREPAPVAFQNGKYAGGVVRPKPGDPGTVMVLHERDEPRTTYLLRRGRYDEPDRSEPLEPGVPESLAAGSEEEPRDRLELARWLVDPEHPLTARVTVNRYWQRFFGRGLVRTSENFGSQGEPPSHPLLLDWLATEFVRRDWDVKSLHRLIVTSATYRQSSCADASRSARDPDNRLLWRAPRRRLSAFTLRDQALALSGLLVERLGGPPAKPYMPPKIWRAISNNQYERDDGANLYRRSVYTYWRRTIPPPMMTTFNAAGREVCSVRKESTNTPLQALTLMNNVAFVEAARRMGRRVLREGGETTDARLAYGFRLATARSPRDAELETLRQAHAAFLQRFRDAPDAARALLGVGEHPRDASLDSVDHAAMTLVASLILNLDETITRE